MNLKQNNKKKVPNFGWHVKHQRHHWRIFISVDDEAHAFQTSPEIPDIFG